MANSPHYVTCFRCGASVRPGCLQAHLHDCRGPITYTTAGSRNLQPDSYFVYQGGSMGMIQGNYIVDRRAGGICLVCGGFSPWEGFSKEEQGVCLDCLLDSDAMMRMIQAREKARQKAFDEITKITWERVVDADWLDKTFGKPYPWNE